MKLSWKTWSQQIKPWLMKLGHSKSKRKTRTLREFLSMTRTKSRLLNLTRIRLRTWWIEQVMINCEVRANTHWTHWKITLTGLSPRTKLKTVRADFSQNLLLNIWKTTFISLRKCWTKMALRSTNRRLGDQLNWTRSYCREAISRSLRWSLYKTTWPLQRKANTT